MPEDYPSGPERRYPPIGALGYDVNAGGPIDAQTIVGPPASAGGNTSELHPNPVEPMGPQPEQLTRPPQKVSPWQVVKAGLGRFIAERKMNGAIDRAHDMQERIDNPTPRMATAESALGKKGPPITKQPIKLREHMGRRTDDVRKRSNFRKNTAAANLAEYVVGNPAARRTRKQNRTQQGARDEIVRAQQSTQSNMGKIRRAADGGVSHGRGLAGLERERDRRTGQYLTAEERYRDTLQGRARYLETGQRNSQELQQIAEFQDQPEVLPEGNPVMAFLGRLATRGISEYRRIDDTERQRTIDDLASRADRVDEHLTDLSKPSAEEEATATQDAPETPEAQPMKTQAEINEMSNKEFAVYIDGQLAQIHDQQARQNAMNQMPDEYFTNYVRGHFNLEAERIQANMRERQGVAKLTNQESFLATREAKRRIMDRFGPVSHVPQFWERF